MADPARTRRLVTLTLALTWALASAGCDGRPTATTSTVQQTSTPPGAARAATTPGVAEPTDELTPSAGDVPASPGPPAPTAPTEPIARVPGDGELAELQIFDLRRVGDVVTVEFGIVTARDTPSFATSHQFVARQDQSTIDGGNLEPGDRRANSVSGVTLIDIANNKRHLVLRDSQGTCLCTLLPRRIEPGTVTRVSAQFPAPPPGITAMSVDVPRFPVVDAVPLRDAG